MRNECAVWYLQWFVSKVQVCAVSCIPCSIQVIVYVTALELQYRKGTRCMGDTTEGPSLPGSFIVFTHLSEVRWTGFDGRGTRYFGDLVGQFHTNAPSWWSFLLDQSFTSLRSNYHGLRFANHKSCKKYVLFEYSIPCNVCLSFMARNAE